MNHWFYRIVGCLFALVATKAEADGSIYIMDICLSAFYIGLAEYCERNPKR